jgi:hypothetical protein
VQLKHMSAHHHALVDFIIENSHERGWRQKACAQFNVTPAYLSVIWKSDIFQEHFYSRLTEWRNGVTRELQAQQIALAKRAYERLMQILNSDTVEDSLVLDVANSTMKNLGFAPSPGAAPAYSKETEITRVQTRELAPGILEQARVTYRKVTSEQLPAVIEQ